MSKKETAKAESQVTLEESQQVAEQTKSATADESSQQLQPTDEQKTSEAEQGAHQDTSTAEAPTEPLPENQESVVETMIAKFSAEARKAQLAGEYEKHAVLDGIAQRLFALRNFMSEKLEKLDGELREFVEELRSAL